MAFGVPLTFFVFISARIIATHMTTKAPKQTALPSDQPQKGFSYSRPFFEDLVGTALGHAKKLGATDAAAEASEGCGLSVSVRKGELENVERNRDKSLGITVYVGQKRGNASTSDFSKKAIEQTVKAAFDIASFNPSFSKSPSDFLSSGAMFHTSVVARNILSVWGLARRQISASIKPNQCKYGAHQGGYGGESAQLREHRHDSHQFLPVSPT